MMHVRYIGSMGLVSLVAGLLVWSGVALAAGPKHEDLDATIKAESATIQGTVATESAGIKTEMAAQHSILSDAQTAIQTDLAEVKALVEALEPGTADPLCGAGTDGQRFVTSSDSTEVCDNDTGLSWVQAPDTTTRTRANALTHCASLDLSNGQTYRLPEVKELFSLVDHSQRDPALPAGHPFSNVQSNRYWSATTFATSASSAWYVRFLNGVVDANDTRGDFFVWCARSGS